MLVWLRVAESAVEVLLDDTEPKNEVTERGF